MGGAIGLYRAGGLALSKFGSHWNMVSRASSLKACLRSGTGRCCPVVRSVSNLTETRNSSMFSTQCRCWNALFEKVEVDLAVSLKIPNGKASQVSVLIDYYIRFSQLVSIRKATSCIVIQDAKLRSVPSGASVLLR